MQDLLYNIAAVTATLTKLRRIFLIVLFSQNGSGGDDVLGGSVDSESFNGNEGWTIFGRLAAAETIAIASKITITRDIVAQFSRQIFRFYSASLSIQQRNR